MRKQLLCLSLAVTACWPAAWGDVVSTLPAGLVNSALQVTGTAGLVSLTGARQGTLATRKDTSPWSVWLLVGGNDPTVLANWRQIATFDENGDLIMNIRPRSGTAAELATELWPSGTICWATDSKRLIVHDGVTVGGIPQQSPDTAAAETLTLSVTGTPKLPMLPITVLPARNIYLPDSATMLQLPGVWIENGNFKDDVSGDNGFTTVSGISDLLLADVVGVTGTLFSYPMATVSSVSCPELVVCNNVFNNSASLEFPQLTTVNLPKLRVVFGSLVYGSLTTSFPKLAVFNVPELEYILGNYPMQILTMPVLTTLSYPKLKWTMGKFLSGTFATLETIDAPEYLGAPTGILTSVISAPNLVTINMPKLKYAGMDAVIFPAAKLSQATIDNLLKSFANMDGTNGTFQWGAAVSFTASGGTNAAPTFTGTSKTSTAIVASTSTEALFVTVNVGGNSPLYGNYMLNGTLNGQNVYTSEHGRTNIWYDNTAAKWTLSATAGSTGAIYWISSTSTGSYTGVGGTTGTLVVSVPTKATATITGHGFSTGDFVTVTGATPAALNGTFKINKTDENTFWYLSPTSTSASVQGSFKWTSSHTDGFWYKQKLMQRGCSVYTN